MSEVRPSSARRWLPWGAGVLGIGTFVTGAAIFATRTDHLSNIARLSGLRRPPELRNELADARSPYLRSAAQQPVAWQQWGPEAFELAARLDRPIWLDIGAIWCHWCHVMDRESYEDPEIAALINEGFVPVKVDRDERPDIDGRYQAAHAALTGQGGGWPLTMFLTPDGRPFAGGTYFPPDSRGGLPGLRQVAPQIATVYREQHQDVLQVAQQVQNHLAQLGAGESAAGSLEPAVVQAVTERVGSAFDKEFGGFGASPGPKFPGSEAIRLALARGFLTESEPLRVAALETLRAYARSGLRDYVNGGFYRYSTNRELTVPHFEKMDYVQSELLRAYLDAFRMTGDSLFASVARDIMRYVDSTLSDRVNGGFYAHQDADISLDDDGSYYTWSVTQIEAAATTAERAGALRLFYGIEEQGEMREDPRQNVLREVRSPAAVARELGMPESHALALLESGRSALLAARQQGPAPLVEQTKFTNRNAMMISAYLEAHESLGDEEARDFALKSLDYLLGNAVESDGSVLHATADGESYVPGFMADYANLGNALLQAYMVSGRGAYLDVAQKVMERAVTLFWDDARGGFFDRQAEPDAPALLVDRKKDFIDAPLPGDNAVAATVLEKLYLLTSGDHWQRRAEETLAAFAAAAAQMGTGAATYALALDLHLNKPAQTVVIGGRDDPRTEALARAAWRTYRPGRLVAVYDPGTLSLEELPPAVAGAARVFGSDPTPRAYVCVGQTCAPPTTSPTDVAVLVRDYGRVGPR
ncbi:MAG: thioredoxin domain-containing protein [Gemmatimonadetes bacterium]|nr:thioredoxin domain-containing protein [Gemmatimonadota bacterium]